MGVALRDLAADCRETVDLDALSGIAAIDAHNALYQFLSIIRQPDGTPLMSADGQITSHLTGLLFRTANLVEKGLRPVYVFDGTPPTFKQETIDQRREVRTRAGNAWKEALRVGDIAEAYKQASASARVDASIIGTAQELLTLLGIPWVQAPSEGEAQAAYMARKGSVRFAVSQDYDSLLFGSPVLVRNLTVSGRRKMRGRTITVSPERIVLDAFLDCLGITREGLVEIGILVGTDYHPGIKGVGGKTALKLVRGGEFESVIAERLPEFDPAPIKEFFLNPPVSDDYHLAWSPPDTAGVIEMLSGRFDFSPERVEGALEKFSVKARQKTLDQWF
ncbi:endonuclease [Methanoculleus taiwanensis]|uniref:Flap endonuclease 1 n=1 Tax=Methanoculleus taiwanensis TaxID=1550565 RepID=A0A498H2Y1_9EURY|nr:flap endonuclease-1 [Methanoculleus taiwanensis]RXE57302.1 endonuclease [Methanoculleus taiwanensis]